MDVSRGDVLSGSPGLLGEEDNRARCAVERVTVNNGTTVHYAPGDGPLCGSGCPDGDLTENANDVTGCADCLELAAEDLADHNEYGGRCLHCHREITAQGGVEWRRAVRRPCPHCGRAGW